MRLVAAGIGLVVALVVLTRAPGTRVAPTRSRPSARLEVRTAPSAVALPETARLPAAVGSSDAELLVKQAVAAWDAGDFARALDDCDRALCVEPLNARAMELRNMVALAVGEAGSCLQIKEWYETTGAAYLAEIQAKEAEAKDRYERGVAWLGAKRYDDAIEEFTAVREKLRARMDIVLSTLEHKAFLRLQEAKALKEIEEVEQARTGPQSAAGQERDRRIRELYRQARVAVDNCQINLSEALCDQVLALDPGAFVRSEVRALFIAAKADAEGRELASLQLRAMARSESESAELPQGEWVHIRTRRPYLGLRHGDERSMELAKEVKEKMRSTLVSTGFRDTPLPDVVTWLRESSRLNILIDERAIPDPGSVRVTLQLVRPEAFDHVIECIVARQGLRSYIDQGCVIITARDE